MPDDPGPMSVLLKVVEVVELQLRNATPAGADSRDDRGRAIQIINRIGPGSYIGALIQETGNDDSSGGILVGDKYTVGQAGAVGPHASAHDISFTQVWNQAGGDINLPALKGELTSLRAAMKEKSTEPEHDIAVAEVASAEVAAAQGDGPKVLEHLARAGRWALSVAVAIGTAVAAAAIKTAIGA